MVATPNSRTGYVYSPDRKYVGQVEVPPYTKIPARCVFTAPPIASEGEAAFYIGTGWELHDDTHAVDVKIKIPYNTTPTVSELIGLVFTDDEWDAAGASEHKTIKRHLASLSNHQGPVNVRDPRFIGGINAMRAEGIIATDGRRDTILKGLPL